MERSRGWVETMKVWLTSFFLLLLLLQVYHSLQHLSLPLPVALLLAAGLAVISNLDQISSADQLTRFLRQRQQPPTS